MRNIFLTFKEEERSNKKEVKTVDADKMIKYKMAEGFNFGEKKITRGFSRLFRRNTQKYELNKIERRSLSEMNLSQMKFNEEDTSNIVNQYHKQQKKNKVKKRSKQVEEMSKCLIIYRNNNNSLQLM